MLFLNLVCTTSSMSTLLKPLLDVTPELAVWKGGVTLASDTPLPRSHFTGGPGGLPTIHTPKLDPNSHIG